MKYTCHPGAKMGERISDMWLRGRPIEPGKRYRVAGWAPVADDARADGGEPIWELAARYLKAQRTIAPRTPNHPKLAGMAGNPGIM